MNAPRRKRVGVVGARGFVGAELVALLDNDPSCEVAFVTSKGAAGQQLGRHTLRDLSVEDVVAADVDAVVFGLQNGQCAPWVNAINAAGKDVVVVDVSADHRFDNAWVYGLTEMNREALRGCTRIANPGCYSTAAQLAILPFQDLVISAHVFGISGYSGAGASPSKKNDTALLRDNLLPYDLVGHTQEKEMNRHSGVDVRFMPHVAPFFRGITCTIALELRRDVGKDDAVARLRGRFAGEALVHVTDDAPLVRDAAFTHGCTIGGVSSAAGRLVLVATIDNLLKGAATQAVQNLHLGLGVPELGGIPLPAGAATEPR